MWIWVILAVLCFVLIFGNSPAFRDTIVQKLRINIIQGVKTLASVNSPILNWFVPIFYGLVITSCLYLFFTNTWLLVPKTIKYSGVHQLYIFLTITSLYSITLICIFSDPGYIDKYNVHDENSHFKNNDIIFFDDNYCSTCKFVKPARSKHCSTCNRCISLMDHHCVWINNCIGYYNYRYFIGWLLSNINLMAYGLYICSRVIPIMKLRSMISTSPVYKITGVFIILCSLFNIIVILFLGLQIRYIYLGVTTNEADKWSEVEHLINIRTLYYRQGKYYEKIGDQLVNMKNDLTYPMFPDLLRIESVEEVENIYDKGFWGNFKEKMFPR